MSHTQQSRPATSASSERLLHILETLPNTLFVLDESDTIGYVNESARTLTETTAEQLVGISFWQGAPQLVSPPLYQAVRTTRQIQAPTEVQYRSPVTHTWLHVQLAPTVAGLMLQFHEMSEPACGQQLVAQSEDLCAALLEHSAERLVILTPDGIVLTINQRSLAAAQARPEQIVGRPLAETPCWSYAPAAQQCLRAAIAQASLGEPVSFEARICPQPATYLDLALTMTPHRDARQQVDYLICAGQDITERKQAEEELRILLDAIPHLIWMSHPDGGTAYTNQRWCEYTGKTAEQAQGDGWLQSIHPEDRPHTQQAWQTAVHTDTPFEVEQRIQQGSTGTYRWFLARAIPYKDEQGRIVRWFGTCTDIDEQKRIEHALRQSREELRVLMETIPQLVWVTRPDGFLEERNQHLASYLNVPLERFNGDQGLPFVHPEDRRKTWTAWQTALRTGQAYEVEQRLREGKTGNYHWFLTRGIPLTGEQGHILKWFGTCTDIEEQKQTERQLKESQEHFRMLAETVPHLVWMMRSDGHLEYTNQRFRDYLGASPQSMLGDEWQPFVHPEEYERMQAARRHALATGERYEVEYRLKESHTGAYRWVLARGMPVRDETGQVLKWFGTSTDIDEQKRTEQALRQSQARARALVDSNLIGVVFVEGKEEVIVEANDAWLHMTGYSQEDVRSGMLTRARITPPEDAPLFERALQELAERGQQTPFETEAVSKNGSHLPVLTGWVLFQQHPRQIIAFTLDNSARKELEQRKDDFIGMASHELRTPLTVLKLQTALLHRQLARQGLQDAAPALSRMEDQITKLTRLVEELLDVSKIQAGRLEYRQERVDLDALLREITETIQQTNPSHRILLQGATRASLLGDPDRLGQVFINLLSNAIKYSPQAQTVEMDLSASEDAVTIRVRDHGLGIPREQREKIFERFYRVPGPKQQAIGGLGMGLYIVAEIIKRHGGTISVQSEVGKGSTFEVTLPRTRES